MPNYYFDHVHLMSEDPEKTAEFYQQVFGAKFIEKRDVGNGRITINLKMKEATLLISTSSENPGIGHFGLRTNDLVSAVNELKAGGLEFTKDVTEIRPGSKISFFKAPDDLLVELVEDKSQEG
ncbi:VOC family protein [Chloroflexota bacterium]